MSTIIKQCVCVHETQDKMYGKGKRVWNQMQSKDGKTERFRCTVCNREEDKR